MFQVSSKIMINKALIKKLSDAQIKALEKTAKALHTEVVQAEVIPRDTGALQNEKTFVDYSQSSSGQVSIVHEGPYARRLYFHPEYNFQKWENKRYKAPNLRATNRILTSLTLLCSQYIWSLTF